MAVILEKVSSDKDGIFKDIVSEQIFDLKVAKEELARYYEEEKSFVKVEYPKDASASVKKAIDYYNSHEIEMGQLAIANNIANARDMINRMEQINLKEDK